jgi:hypothetical protein
MPPVYCSSLSVAMMPHAMGPLKRCENQYTTKAQGAIHKPSKDLGLHLVGAVHTAKLVHVEHLVGHLNASALHGRMSKLHRRRSTTYIGPAGLAGGLAVQTVHCLVRHAATQIEKVSTPNENRELETNLSSVMPLSWIKSYAPPASPPVQHTKRSGMRIKQSRQIQSKTTQNTRVSDFECKIKAGVHPLR